MATKRDLLYEAIDDSSDPCEFIQRMIQHIPLDIVQIMMKEKLNTFDDAEINNIFHNVFPTDYILPTAIVQKILSFNQYAVNHKLVNKSFKKLSDKNERIDFQKRIENEPKIDIENKHFKNANYWIVDQNRSQLTDKEICSGHQGPINNILNAIEQCQSGDILLVYDGIYHIPFNYDDNDNDDYNDHMYDENIIFRKKIGFIGKGSNVIFKTNETMECRNDVYFKNISFDCLDVNEEEFLRKKESMLISNNSNVWMEECHFELNDCHGICMHYQAKNISIHLRECVFNGNNMWTAVSISSTANNVDIIGCKFRNCGFSKGVGYVKRSSIYIQGFDNTQFRIIGNIIINDAVGMPIASYHVPIPIDANHEITNNLITGKNSTFNNKNNRIEHRNPNTIYPLND